MSLTLKHAVVTRRAKLFVDGGGGLQMQCTVKYDGVFYSLGSYNPVIIAFFLKYGLEEAMLHVQGSVAMLEKKQKAIQKLPAGLELTHPLLLFSFFIKSKRPVQV